MRRALPLTFFLALTVLPVFAAELKVEAAAEMWPVWERLIGDNPLPRDVQAHRSDPGADSRADLVMTLGREAGAREVELVVLAPVAELWDAGRSVSTADIQAGRVAVAPVESITLPRIALPVDGLFPDQPGYPLIGQVSLRLRSDDPVIRAWFDSLPAPAGSPRTEITWVGAVGDIMPARGVDAALLSPGGARRVFGDALPVLASCNLLLGNLEAAATSRGTAVKKTYRFRFDPAALRVLKETGFTYLSLSNNHTFDYGSDGFLDTLANLSRWGIGTSGAGADESEAEMPLIESSGSTELRVLSFGAYPIDRTGFDGRKVARAGAEKPGTLWLDDAGLEEAARGFSAGAFNIAMVHGGEEWNARPVPEQIRLYRELIHAGADVVIGSHPHVLQGMEAFHGGVIVYSLGNFLFPGMEGTRGGQDSFILKVGVLNGKLRYLQMFPVRLGGTSVRLAPHEGSPAGDARHDFRAGPRRLSRRAGAFRRRRSVQELVRKGASMKTLSKCTALGLSLAAALALASCETTNNLSMYQFEGTWLASEMEVPPEPQVSIRYDITLDPTNAFASSLNILTNIAKAAQGQKAEQAMREALSSVDVPGIILAQSSAACVDALGATATERSSEADYILTLSIRDWGIEAASAGTAVRLWVRMTARITDRRTDDLVWRRTISVSQPASPQIFGLGEIIGNMVTATTLSNMTPEELASGFGELGRQIAEAVAGQLGSDLDSARAGY